MPQKIRQPSVAGAFYPDDPERLKIKINKYLTEADSAVPALEGKNAEIHAILAPHAGYEYSGGVAAYSYRAIQGNSYSNVFLICNSHSDFFSGIAVDDSDAWETPLGQVEVNKELAGRLAAQDNSIRLDGGPHLRDHTLEVQLPFLQSVLKGEFKIVPLFFGNRHEYSFKSLAQALQAVMGENDLIVISTDMSHYPAYQDANRIDPKTLELIAALDLAGLESHIDSTEAENVPGEDTLLCGVDGVKAAMEIGRSLGWQAAVLKYANSGDAEIGDKSKVVGYGAVAFYGKIPAKEGDATESEAALSGEAGDLTEEQKTVLLKIAKQTVESYVKNREIPEFEIKDERLMKKEGAFVTIGRDGQLRGCIGRFAPTDLPLWQVVRQMAIAAATEDHRFSPVKENELPDLEYEISVLSVPEKIASWQDIVLGRHGVVVRKGLKSGVFLPQVATDTGWNKEEFLSQLCYQKAGLPPDCYKNDKEVEILVFTANVFNAVE